jgi:hypothetical protein
MLRWKKPPLTNSSTGYAASRSCKSPRLKAPQRKAEENNIRETGKKRPAPVLRFCARAAARSALAPQPQYVISEKAACHLIEIFDSFS